ncbi:MAG: hypothetical protein CL549_15805 [Alcanivorax sp.]|nr:hypothetical protein [Alcanivorax sp.]MAY11924.1 hypothetical protein [Alcanivorax sp.]MBI56760.1 hypothetical protein [Alcanivorax sp.]|tara:strand:- start:4 stop:465 length:462 start_codon:yes stop_codon:yes gene_type:complete
MIQSRLVLAVAMLAVGVAVGWFINGWRWDARHTAYQLAQSQLVVEAQALAASQAEQWRGEVEALDRRHTEELEHAEQTISALRGRIADGSVGVRVAARCPDVPADAGPAGVGDAGACELTAAAQQDYLDLRAQYTRQWHQLLACQDYIRSVRQ